MLFTESTGDHSAHVAAFLTWELDVDNGATDPSLSDNSHWLEELEDA